MTSANKPPPKSTLVLTGWAGAVVVVVDVVVADVGTGAATVGGGAGTGSGAASEGTVVATDVGGVAVTRPSAKPWTAESERLSETAGALLVAPPRATAAVGTTIIAKTTTNVAMIVTRAPERPGRGGWR